MYFTLFLQYNAALLFAGGEQQFMRGESVVKRFSFYASFAFIPALFGVGLTLAGGSSPALPSRLWEGTLFAVLPVFMDRCNHFFPYIRVQPTLHASVAPAGLAPLSARASYPICDIVSKLGNFYYNRAAFHAQNSSQEHS
jgi:hypothetical protein